MLKVNCVATASADREGGSEPLLTSGRADRQTDPTALPIVGARTDDALAFLSAYLPACPRVEVTMPVCLGDEIQSDSYQMWPTSICIFISGRMQWLMFGPLI